MTEFTYFLDEINNKVYKGFYHKDGTIDALSLKNVITNSCVLLGYGIVAKLKPIDNPEQIETIKMLYE